MRKALGIATLPLLAFASAARAEMNEVQIDWIIAQDEWSQVSPSVGQHSVTYQLRGVPRKLYSAVEEVIARDGTKLLPAGAQLYGMTGPKLAACSQAAMAKGYAGSKNRVCLRDEDGDGRMDVYWLRPPAKKLFGQAEWFAMNTQGMQVSGSPVSPPTIAVVASAEATMKMEITATVGLKSNGTGAARVFVRDGVGFSGNCIPADQKDQPIGMIRFSCLVPDLVIQTTPIQGQDYKSSRLSVSTPRREVGIKFQMSAGLLVGRGFEYMYFE